MSELRHWTDEYLELLRTGLGDKAAAGRVGVDPREVSRYEAMEPAFRDAVHHAKEAALDEIEGAVHEIAKRDGNTAMKILRAKRPEDWMEPDRNTNLTITMPELESVSELHARLLAAKEAGEIMELEEVTDDDGDE